jgi:hypothetical protein
VTAIVGSSGSAGEVASDWFLAHDTSAPASITMMQIFPFI